MPTMYQRSDENTRNIRTVTKLRENVWNKAECIDLTKCIDLIGKEFVYPVPGEFKTVDKKLYVIDLYPKNILAVYPAGTEDDAKDIRVCLSIGDLIERGIITLQHGYVEVLV